MEEQTRTLSRRTFVAGAIALGATSLASPLTALATQTAAEKQAEADSVRVQVEAMQTELGELEDTYNLAVIERDEAQAAADEAAARIEELNAQIADTQETLASRASGMYRSGQTTFLDLLLGASTFEEFANNWALLTRMNDNDAALVQQTKDLRAEAEAQKAVLDEQRSIAEERAAEAEQTYAEAQDTLAELEALLDTLDAEAQALLEQEIAAQREAEYAAQQKAAEEAAAQAQQQTQGPSSGTTPEGGTASGGSAGGNSYGYSGGDGSVSYPQVADLACTMIGYPHVLGEEGLCWNVDYVAFDCSGLVRWAYLNAVGISLPHFTDSIFAVAKWRGPVSQARRGDVLYCPDPTHAGIALCDGGTRYVHAPQPGARVRDTDPLSWAGFTYALRF